MDILTPQPTSVYRYYDESGLLIYVGITARGMRRNREHNATKDWWQFVTRQEVEHYETRGEALAREVDLVTHHAPPFNTIHNPDHEKCRTAYLLFASARSQPSSWNEEVRDRGMRVELDHHTYGNPERLTLRTRIEDVSITSAIMPPSGVMPKAVGLRKLGRVVSVRKVGPCVLFELSSTSKHPVSHGVAFLKFGSNQRHLEVRHIEARLDHSDRTFCDPKCPRPRSEVA